MLMIEFILGNVNVALFPNPDPANAATPPPPLALKLKLAPVGHEPSVANGNSTEILPTAPSPNATSL